jgi:signal peptide peptidase SppA
MSDPVPDSPEAVAEFKLLMSDPAARQAFVEIRHKKQEEGVHMRYEHVMKAVFGSPWAIREEYLTLIADIVLFRAAGGRMDAEEIEQRIAGARRQPSPDGPPGVAVIPLQGVIIPKAGGMSEMSGGTSVERFRAAFRSAVASPSVSSIVLDVDSPGGMVDGVPEMAAEIRAARAVKPIVAFANTEANSAAYWLASQAGEIVVSRSSRIGSIGVLTAHEDKSKMGEMKGLHTTLISAGRFKTEGNPFEPLSDEARVHLQGLVDDYYGMFVSDVAKGRGVSVSDVRGGFGQGRVVGARDAIAQGMADRAGTLDSVVGELLDAAPPALRSAHSSTSVTASALAVVALGDQLPGDDTELPTAEPDDPVPVPDPDPEVRAEEPEEEVPAVVVTAQARPIGAAVDNSAWDGNRAMGQCHSASDFEKIAFARTTGDSGQRQHYALPHHYLGSWPSPNRRGVAAALGRYDQTEGLANRRSVSTHLESHRAEIERQSGSAITDDEIRAANSEDEILRLEAELAVLAE